MDDRSPINGPTLSTFSIMEFAMLFAEWQAGREVVLGKSRITVDGKTWVQPYSTDIVQPKRTFRFQDGKWTICFDAKESQFKDSVGLQYVHLLLSRGRLSPSQLIYLVNSPDSGRGANTAKARDFEEGGCFEGLTIQTESKGASMTKETHKIIRIELPELKRELELLIDAGDRERAEALEEKIKSIEQQLKKAHFKGLEHPFSYQYKRDLDSVRLATNRAIKSLGTVNPTLAWHLTASIKFGVQCVYHPENPVHWDL